ncbi:MAG: nucleotide sugar dehydrogenase [Emcibacter sp.]|nr:nucleotide sugar dehydrogenase [Emcibacter sp.]MBL4893678.1 nucleotide sugar dehydrogenase [Emcibacter sp.]
MLENHSLQNEVQNEPYYEQDAILPSQAHRVGISVIGLGYVGAVTSVCFADLGYQVIGVDLDEEKILGLNNGIPPIIEDGLPEKLSLALNRHRFKATTDAINAILDTDVTLVSVCTPSLENGGCNIDYLKVVSETIGQALAQKDRYHLILFRSTVPPGTTRKELIPIIEKVSGKKCGADFGVCFNPEFLRETTAIEDFHQPPKTVIGGCDEFAARMTSKLYENVGGKVFCCSLEVAEFVKYIDNTWHALKVSFGNEVGRLCKAAEIDSHDVMKIFCQDKKLNISAKYLMPGTAFGGSCLPKDVRGMQYLSDQYHVDLPVINSIIHSNEAHISHAVKLICEQSGRKVGFLGVTFKSGTDDMRESPTFEMIEQLKDMKYEVLVHDENLNSKSVSHGYGSDIVAQLLDMRLKNALRLCEVADIIVVAHHTPEYQRLLELYFQKKPIIDLVRLDIYDRSIKDYHGVCW